ncbi:AAA family ATPase [Sinorhizobium meliloti]
MIVWINGPFGAGKTTLAERLRDRRPGSLIFDPEEIGFVVKATVPKPASGVYQDLPVWRGLTIAALREIRRHYSQDMFVPMTLVQPEYLDEILDGVMRVNDQFLHIFLTLNEELLRHRIAIRPCIPIRIEMQRSETGDWLTLPDAWLPGNISPPTHEFSTVALTRPTNSRIWFSTRSMGRPDHPGCRVAP